MKNMSFALTTLQACAQVKSVTRRLGWLDLKPGILVQQVVKGMGLKPGEQVQKIHVIKAAVIRREPLRSIVDKPRYGREEMVYEGFPNMTTADFVDMFCASHKGCTPESIVTRIEFKYVSPTPLCKCGCAVWYIDPTDKIRCFHCSTLFVKVYPQWAGER